jgi:hypothetical protein
MGNQIRSNKFTNLRGKICKVHKNSITHYYYKQDLPVSQLLFAVLFWYGAGFLLRVGHRLVILVELWFRVSSRLWFSFACVWYLRWNLGLRVETWNSKGEIVFTMW